MKKLKSIVIAIVLLVVLHVISIFILSDSKIFPCEIRSVGGNMQMSPWRDGTCDVNYRYWIGSVQKLTPGAAVARIGLIYILPILATVAIMNEYQKIKKKKN